MRCLAIGLVALLLSAGTAAAASAPTAITGAVTAVGPNTATMHGTVNPNGVATTWQFEYGTTTSYGSKTASQSAGAGTANLDVLVALASLHPGTTYHYRLDASSTAGTSHGADGIFTTSAAPGAVTNAASGVTSTTATLNGIVDPNGRAATAYFEYGTSTSYGTKTPAKSAGSGESSVPMSVAISGLKAGRTYHYRLVATSDAGTARGADVTFSTGSAPVVATGSASAIGPTSAIVDGTVNPNGQSTSWYFEYGTTTSYGSKTASHSAGSGTQAMSISTTLSGLTPGTTYHFRLVATNAAGTSPGADHTFGTAGPPGARTGPAQSIQGHSATLTGSTDARGRATTWYFDFGTTTAYGSRTATQSGGTTAGDHNVLATIAGLTPGVTYHYRLVASNDAGTTNGGDLTFTTATLTLSAAPSSVAYGGAVTLSGLVSSRDAGQHVLLQAQRYGEGLVEVATVTTGAGGIWSYRARPAIMTSYAAVWLDVTSRTATVGIRPLVAMRALSGGRFSIRVSAARSFAGRIVALERSHNGRWLVVKRVRLGIHGTVTTHPLLPHGRSLLRVVTTARPAGYLAGISRTLAYRRR